MKSYKFLFLFLSILLAAGCASASENVETSAVPTEETVEITIVEETSTSVETEASVPEEDGEALYAEFKKSGINFREDNKPPETEDPTLAEEIYRLLYDFADLSDTLWYIEDACRNYFRDPETGGIDRIPSPGDDYITAESAWINPGAGPGDENFALVYTDYYARIRYGEIKTVNDYYQRMSRVATWEYMDLDSPWLGDRIRSSDGNLYVSDFRVTMGGLPESASELKKITKIDEDTLRLDFTATDYYAETRIESRDYSVTISKGKSYCRDCEPDGKWRVDRCCSVDADTLTDEIIRGGINGQNPKTDLPEQIEQCLKESGLM